MDMFMFLVFLVWCCCWWFMIMIVVWLWRLRWMVGDDVYRCLLRCCCIICLMIVMVVRVKVMIRGMWRVWLVGCGVIWWCFCLSLWILRVLMFGWKSNVVSGSLLFCIGIWRLLKNVCNVILWWCGFYYLYFMRFVLRLLVVWVYNFWCVIRLMIIWCLVVMVFVMWWFGFLLMWLRLVVVVRLLCVIFVVMNVSRWFLIWCIILFCWRGSLVCWIRLCFWLIGRCWRNCKFCVVWWKCVKSGRGGGSLFRFCGFWKVLSFWFCVWWCVWCCKSGL